MQWEVFTYPFKARIIYLIDIILWSRLNALKMNHVHIMIRVIILYYFIQCFLFDDLCDIFINAMIYIHFLWWISFINVRDDYQLMICTIFSFNYFIGGCVLFFNGYMLACSWFPTSYCSSSYSYWRWRFVFCCVVLKVFLTIPFLGQFLLLAIGAIFVCFCIIAFIFKFSFLFDISWFFVEDEWWSG